MSESIVAKYKSFLTENFSIESIVLGSGEFSSVHLARNRATKEPAAAKIVDLENYPHQFLSELRAMSACKHENIAAFFGFRMGRSSPSGYLFIEYLPYPTLESFVTHAKHAFTEKKAFQILEQLVSACITLHEHGISHHDLKPDNVLMNRTTGQVKIIDFGLSVAFEVSDPVVRHPSGTPLYLPPEVLEDLPHDPRGTDIWSLGITLYFMLTKEYPWGDDLSEDELLAAIKTVPVDYRRFSSKSKTILKGMLNLNSKTRITGSEARNVIKEVLNSHSHKKPKTASRETTCDTPEHVEVNS